MVRGTELGEFERLDDERGSQFAADSPPSISSETCSTNPVPAGSQCVIEVLLPAGLAPGAYALGVSVVGQGGGVSQQQVKANVRLHWLYAAVIVLIGAALGTLAADWRAKFQDRERRRLVYATVRDRAREVQMNDRGGKFEERFKKIFEELDKADKAIFQDKNPEIEASAIQADIDKIKKDIQATQIRTFTTDLLKTEGSSETWFEPPEWVHLSPIGSSSKAIQSNINKWNSF